ncbi:MAG: CPBP family intramembrane glutamic endopeptidase [Thermofilum sp.]
MSTWKSLTVFIAVSYGLAAAIDFATRQVVESEPPTSQLLVALPLAWGLVRMYTPTVAALASALLVDRVERSKLRSTLGLSVTELSVKYFLLAPLLVLPPLFAALALELALGALEPRALLTALPGLHLLEPRLAAATFMAVTLLSGYLAAVTINAIYALGEEIGWRGYLYTLLWPRLGPLKATLVIGAAWGLWHYTAALLLGHNYQTHRVEGPLVFTAITTLMTAPMLLLRRSSGSVLPAASFHGAVNAWWGLTVLLAPSLGELQGGLGAVGLAAWALALPAILAAERLLAGRLGAGK